MKALLVALNAKYIHSNPAVYSLKAYAEKQFDCDGDLRSFQKSDIEIAEYTINQPFLGILTDIYRRKADVIFFSCYIWNIRESEQLAEEIGKIMPDIDIWFGGPEVSYNSKDILEKFNNIKGVIKGEGEETFYQILKAYEKKERNFDDNLILIKGIVFRKNTDEIEETLNREYMDLSLVPFLYNGTDGYGEKMETFENRIIYYESSRGCPFRCSYCLSSIDKKLRFRNIDMVKAELGYFLKNNVPQVKFIDRTFNCNHERAAEIWRFLKENDNGITNFHFEIAGDILSSYEIKLIKTMRAGQIQLEIGVQSTNGETLREINRPMDFEKLSETVNLIKQGNNVHIHLDLIAGLPFEGYKRFSDSFNDVFLLRPHQLQLGFLKVLKGSPMKENSLRYGLKFTSSPPYEVLETKWISYDEIIKLKGIEDMVEIYYNSGQFSNTIEVLLKFFETPFQLFESLASWHEENNLEMINVSRKGRYENLIKFISSQDIKVHGQIEDMIIIDYYMRENAKNRPDFFRKSEVERSFEKKFYGEEAKNHRYLKGKEFNTDDSRVLRKLTHMEKIGDKYYLFNYEKRNPMDNNAEVMEVKKYW